MDGDKHWWFCLKHNTVEDDDGVCPGKDRLGPYPTQGGRGARTSDGSGAQRAVGLPGPLT